MNVVLCSVKKWSSGGDTLYAHDGVSMEQGSWEQWKWRTSGDLQGQRGHCRHESTSREVNATADRVLSWGREHPGNKYCRRKERHVKVWFLKYRWVWSIQVGVLYLRPGHSKEEMEAEQKGYIMGGFEWPVQGFSYYPKEDSETSMALRLCVTVRKCLVDNIMF